MAEVWFVYKLYIDDLIPPLFYEGQSYWCASGKVSPSGNGVSGNNDLSGTSPVRCVYDEWYWEHSKLRMDSVGTQHPNIYNRFTWGDEAE